MVSLYYPPCTCISLTGVRDWQQPCVLLQLQVAMDCPRSHLFRLVSLRTAAAQHGMQGDLAQDWLCCRQLMHMSSGSAHAAAAAAAVVVAARKTRRCNGHASG